MVNHQPIIEMEVLAMKRLISVVALLLVLMTLIAVLPAAASAETKLRVTASWLRLRSGPGTEYKILNKYKAGSIVTVLTTKTDKHWYYVKTSKGQTGWMYKGYLSATNDTPAPARNANGSAVAKRNVNLRTGPGKKYDVIQLLPAGQTMTIVGKTGTWYKVIAGKQTGYVMKSLIKIK